MNAFLFAAEAVLPIILTVAIGYLLGRIGLLGERVSRAVNKLVFRLLLPCMLFLNVYKIESFSSVRWHFVLYAVGATLLFFLAAFPLSALAARERNRRGVLIQSVFRSNYALIGIPLATALFGAEGAAVATLLSAFSIPLYNVLATVCLCFFGSGERPSVKKLLLGVIKNPLIISIALGCVCLGVRSLLVANGIAFRLSNLTPVFTVLSQLSASATPIALLALGAQFTFSAVPALKREIVFGVLARTVAVPAIGLAAAYALGIFDGAHFAAFVALFATPVAVSSVPMTQELGGDTALAGQLVVWSTLVSALTVFLVTFLLRLGGAF